MKRLRDKSAIEALKQFVGQHLGHHYRVRLPVPFRPFTELEKMQMLPLLFGLLPRRAALRDSMYEEVKPLIREHLSSTGVEFDELLVEILKDLCDNFDRTRPADQMPPGRHRPRKFGLSNVRQLRAQYRELLDTQRNRCATCGCRFSDGYPETLDHIVPWRLGGDPPDGSNWQLLCDKCNGAKGHVLSSLMFPEYHNWVYADSKESSVDCSADRISLRSRFLALTVRAKCEAEGCQNGPRDAALIVVRRSDSAFSVLDHLLVLCQTHADAQGRIPLFC